MPPRAPPFLGLLCVALAACGSTAADRMPGTPSASRQSALDVSEFVPPGFKLLRVVRGDLNADGREDALVIATRDASDPQRRFTRRVLSIVVARASGGFDLASRNSVLAACQVCGGAQGDGLSDVSIKTGELVVVNEGGIRARWSDVYTFRFDAAAVDWLLVRYSARVSSQMDQRSERIESTAEDFGIIRFADLTTDALPRPTID